MKSLVALIILILGASPYASADIDLTAQRDCKLSQFVEAPYFGDEKPEVGSSAVVFEEGKYQLITLQNLLNDNFIYFKSKDGKLTENYLWLYGTPVEIQTTSILNQKKFYSASVVGDTIITLAERGKSVDVKYANTESGLMLSMKCEGQ